MNMQHVYELEALIELGQSFPNSLTATVIGRRRKIPVKFLSRLLAELARRNIVVTTRGPSGGVRLASPPEKIELVSLVPSIVMPDKESPAIRWLVNNLHFAQNEVLLGLNLSTLVEVERRSQTENSFEI